MSRMFEKWKSEIFPSMRKMCISQSAKSRRFWDGKKWIENNKIDQSMYSHILNAVTVAHSIIKNLRLVEKKIMTEDDEFIAYCTITLHDIHKFTDPLTNSPYGQSFSMDILKDFSVKCSMNFPDVVLKRMKSCINFNHEKEFTAEERLKDPKGTYVIKDIVFHLLKISDAVASSEDTISAYNALIKSINNMEVNIPSVSSISMHFTYHIIPQCDGDLSLLLHKMIQEEVKDSMVSLFYFEDGTIYFSKSTAKFPDNIIDEISIKLIDYLQDDLITFKVQANTALPMTKEYEKNFNMGTSWNQFINRLQEYSNQQNFVKNYENNCVLEKLSKGSGALSVKIKDELNSNPKFKTIFDNLSMNEYKYLSHYFVIILQRLLSDYQLDNWTDEKMLDFFECIDKDSLKILDVKDSGGGRQANWISMYTFPIAKKMYDNIYKEGMNQEEYISNCAIWIENKLTTKYPSWKNKILSNCGINDKIKKILNESIGFESYPIISVDQTFGLMKYTNELKSIKGSYTANCFLCNTTEELMEVNPDAVGMGLQIQSDRVPSGVGINASNIKRICFKCWIRSILKKKKYPYITKDNSSNAYYLVLKPDYLFSRDHAELITKNISPFMNISEKNYTELKKFNDSDEINDFLDKKIRLLPFTISKMINGLIWSIKNGLYNEIISNIIEITENATTLWIDSLSEEDLGLFKDNKTKTLLGKFECQNGYILPVLFNGDKENSTSQWFAMSLLSGLVYCTTGCRVIVTQDYGNIPLLSSNAVITLDNPPIYVQKIFGSIMELSNNDLEKKFITGSLLWYLNSKYSKYVKIGDERDNTIPYIIDTYMTKPNKMIDLCYRYITQNEKKSTDPEFYRISSIVQYLNK